MTEQTKKPAQHGKPTRNDKPAQAAGPHDAARPENLAEAAALLADTATRKRTVLIAGAGTAAEWGGTVDAGDAALVLHTGALDQPVSHAAEDWTVTLQAGMPLDRLQELLAPAGQWLPLDPPAARAGATLGGLLATGDSGPLRLAHGALGDLVIGATVVAGDGRVVRTGGNVIKNVAGYDLAKLYAGSLGAYGLIAQLTLRVHPRPQTTATLAVPAGDAGQALDAARAVLASPLDPVAAEWDGARLLVRFHGTPDGTAARVRRAAELPALAGSRILDDDARQAAWAEVDARIAGEEGDTVLRAGSHPARLPELARRMEECAREAGVEAGLVSSPALGVHTVRLRGGDAAGHAACLTAWRAAVHDTGGSVTLRRRRDGVDAAADAWGPAPATAPLLRALKQRFDPAGRCAPGRFAPWF